MSISREALAAMTPEQRESLLLALANENAALKAAKPVQKLVRFRLGHSPRSGENEGKPQCYLLVGMGRSTTYVHLNGGHVLTTEGRAKAAATLDAIDAQVAECRKAL